MTGLNDQIAFDPRGVVETKPLALAIMGLTALFGFFHYTRVGPNETDERDEAAAQDLARKSGKQS